MLFVCMGLLAVAGRELSDFIGLIFLGFLGFLVGFWIFCEIFCESVLTVFDCGAYKPLTEADRGLNFRTD